MKIDWWMVSLGLIGLLIVGALALGMVKAEDTDRKSRERNEAYQIQRERCIAFCGSTDVLAKANQCACIKWEAIK